jgi:hypothetical protein
MNRAFFAAVSAASLATSISIYAFASRAEAPDSSPSHVAGTAGGQLAEGLARKLAAPPLPPGDEPYVGADAGAGFTWDIPDTWFQGGIYPFPLSFAPSIPGAGEEVVEQTPNFFTATSNEYFSYTFAWWLEGNPDITAAQLSTDFAAYYSGLMDGCTYGQYATVQPCNVANYTAHFDEVLSLGGGRRAVKAFLGEAQLYDFFVTGNLIKLKILASTYDCHRDGHRVVLFSASPAPFTDPVWKELLERQAAFTCQ